MIPLPHYMDEALREFLNRILRGDANVVIVEIQDDKYLDMLARRNEPREVTDALLDAALLYTDKSRT